MKTCNICKNKYNDVTDENHEQNCTNIFHQEIKCQCCSKFFHSIYEDNFKEHQKTCEETFLDKLVYEAPKLDEGDVNTGRAVHCFKCDKIVLKKDIKAHFYEVCQKTNKNPTAVDKKGECFICKESISLSEIILHVENCKKNSTRFTQCELCDKYISGTSVYKHYQFVHGIKYVKKKGTPTAEKKTKEVIIKCMKCEVCLPVQTFINTCLLFIRRNM